MKTKFIVVADSCENKGHMKRIVRFAKENGVDSILDVGGLHRHISLYAGLRVFATHWDGAEGGMDKRDFSREIYDIGGTVVRNGTAVSIDGLWFLMRYNLIGHNSKMSDDVVRRVVNQLSDESPGKKYALSGNTHLPYLRIEGDVVLINPGASKDGLFVVLDVATNEIEFRTTDRILFRYNGPSSVVGIRGLKGLFQYGAYVLLLENGMEQLYFQGRVSDVCDRVVGLVYRVKNEKVLFVKYKIEKGGVCKTFDLTENK